MKKSNPYKNIAVIFSWIGIILACLALLVSFTGIGAKGFERLGIILLGPSLLAIGDLVGDAIIASKEKKMFVYSLIESVIKIILLVLMIPSAIYDYNYQMKYGFSNLDFDIIVINFLVIMLIPSLMNMILSMNKK